MSCSLKEEHHQVLEVVEDGTESDQRGQYGERKVETQYSLRGMVTEKLRSSSATQDLRYDGVRNIPLASTLSLETGIAYQL